MTDTAEPQTQPSQQNAQAQQPQQSSQQSKHMMTPREKKWIVYDVGNSAFVLLSTAVVPIYANSLLKAAGETNIVSTWGYAQTIASLVIAVLMPLLGSIADVQGMKIRFFTGFFLTGVVMCCAMAMPLGWLAFLIVYVLAIIGLMVRLRSTTPCWWIRLRTNGWTAFPHTATHGAISVRPCRSSSASR